MVPVLQDTLPYDVHDQRPLPGIAPLDPGQWLMVDEAFAGQMGLRDQLLRDRRADVLAMDECARDAAGELLDRVLALAYPGGGSQVTRPDGIQVKVDRHDPLATLGRLVQEDFCILQKTRGEHVLTGAIVCFPANWTLSEKFGRALMAIHDPVSEYGPGLAKRVQRLFDGVRPAQPMWRFNALWYDDPDLFQPSRAGIRNDLHKAKDAPYFRSERQCILRLPRSDAVVFSIHTFVLHRAALARAGKGCPPS